MKRPGTLLKLLLVVTVLGLAYPSLAQTKYWTGGNGLWDDGAKWSNVPGGAGGAGVPRVNEDVVIAPSAPVTITFRDPAWCKDLRVDASNARVRLNGPTSSEVNIAGAWQLAGQVEWNATGLVRLGVRREGVELDPRGTRIAGAVVLDGSGTWSLISDLNTAGDLFFTQGTFITNGNGISARNLVVEARARGSFMAGNAVIQLEQQPDLGALRIVVQPGSSTLVVAGSVVPWEGTAQDAQGDRDINVCGTGPGQTPFTVNAQLTTNYNGFGVRCRGNCNATVTVSVTGGSGNFTYQWLNGGPPTATWTTACGGPQLVIVTDVGQGISCPAQVNVTEPAPVGVIFFGQGTPPTCAGVCDGTRTALGIGGVSPHTYNWNNGAGTNSSFNALCAGANTLVITDLNNCTFDTTFIFNLSPILPNLTFTDAGCFGECNGEATVAPTGGTGQVGAVWSPAPPVGQGTFTASALCAGDYNVTLTDVNGCDTTVFFTIAEPPPIIPNLVTTDASCSDACDGTATASPSGAVGPYIFDWSPEPGGGQGTGSATGLCAAIYTVLITDQTSGCDTLLTFEIDAPPSIDVQGTVTDALCSNTCDGEIDLSVAGGTDPYTFLWSPVPPAGQGTGSVTGLCPGDWSVTVTDQAGCDTTVVFTVGAPPPLDPVLTSTDVTCAGACDGTASVVVSGGVAPYTFLWTPPPAVGQGTPDVTGLCAGDYTLLVSDVNGCDTTLTFTILEPPPLVVDPDQSDITCGSLCNGIAAAAVSGGTPGYTYLWTPAPPIGQGTPEAWGLCAGPISVLITDANGCTITQDFVILDAVPITISLQLTPATCPSTCDGTAGVIVGGGVPTYTYLWDPAPGGGQGSPNATGLCAQAYSLTVTDAVGCDTTISFTIDAPEPILPNGTQTDVTCAGTCDGTITVAPTGGNGTYTYNWSPAPGSGQGSATAGGLCAGDWSVTITSGACDTTVTFTILEPPPIIATVLATDASCSDVCDGTAEVTASGGTPPLAFTWSPEPGSGQGTPNVGGLCPGIHTVTVSDALGCDTTLSVTVNAPPPLVVVPDQTDVTCGALCDGIATVTVSGGTPGYTYLWTPAPPVGQGTPEASGLCAGPISVLITDANGCTITQDFVILDAVAITISLQLTPASCPNTCDGTAGVIVGGGVPDYSYFWDPAPGGGQGSPNATGLCAQAYSLTVTDAVGCDTTISFTIDSPEPIVPNALQTDATCAGTCDGTITLAPTGGNGTYTYSWSPAPGSGQGSASVSGLCAGDWSVTITSGGCDTTVTFTVIEPPPINAIIVATDATCHDVCDGTAEVTASGGTPALSFSWSPEPGSGQGTPIVGGLCPGIYSVTVSDALGCDTTLNVTILAPPPIDPVLTTTPETCVGPCTGTATVAPTGGTGTILVDWQPEPGGGQGSNTATGLCSGTTYTVTLTDDNGCDTTATFTILPSAVIEPNGSTTQTSCAGVCDGTATVGPTGGAEPYQYVWSPEPATGQGTPSATGFCAGPVQVTITDAALCTVVANLLILEADPIVDNATVTQPQCAGICDGSIVLNTQGGVPPYTYEWSPEPPTGQGTNTITQLCPGTWNVTITGSAGCTVDFSYEIVAPPALTLDVVTTPSQCQVCIGSATATGGGGTGALTYEWTGPGGVPAGNTPTITDLCAGIYTVTLRDDNGCELQRIVSITDSDGEVLSTTDGVTTCPDTCDGEVSVSFTCSDPPCIIAWTDANGVDLGESGNTVSDLCPGDYYVSVTNASGCLTIDTATVEVPIVVVLNISSSPVSCNGICDGTATVGLVGGTPPFTFTWTPEPGAGQGTPNVSGLCVGVYEVSVGDGGGCTTVAEVLILGPTPINEITADVDQITCAGECDGAITATFSGGTEPYTLAWSPAPPVGQGTNSASGFCAGPITLLVTDANGCTLERNYVIIEPQALAFEVTTTPPTTCGVCDATGSITVTGGTGPFTFQWVDIDVIISDEQAPTDLCAGVYTVVVTDAAGCSAVSGVVINDLVGEDITVTNGQTLCSNACDGEVTVSYICSAPPCFTTWADADGNVLAMDTDTLSELCEGVYTAIVTNADGCTTTAEAMVSPSQTILPNLSSTPVTCFSDCDATATVGPVGGVEPYEFTWSPEPGGGQGTPMATGLCAGVYEVLIADASGCDTTVQVLILEPALLEQQAFVMDATCSGECNGSIVVTPTGGTAPYTFVWSPVPPNGQGSNGAFDLCAGDYELTVTDANACTSVMTWTVNEPDPLVLVGGSVSSECGVCNGEAFVSVSGGTMPYTYLWTQGGNIFGTADSLDALCAGVYNVLVIDAQGCEAALPVPVQDIDGEVLDAFGDTTSCPGICDGTVQVDFNCGTPNCSVAWFDAFGNDLGQSGQQVIGLCAGTYFVQVTNGIGCIAIDTAVVAEPDPVIPNLSTTPVTCFGTCDGTATVGPTGGVPPYDYFWDPAPQVGQGTPQAEGLCAGTYEVTITDDAGCELVVAALILGPPILTAEIITMPISCNGLCDASIVVTPQGGIGPYTYNWTPEPPNGPGSNSATDLCPGDWSVQVVDANGCDTTYTITIVDPPLLEAQLTTTDNICFGECLGTATAQITGGVEPYAVTWTDGGGLLIAQDTSAIDTLCAGDYTLNIIDANGCELIVPFSITQGTAIEAGLVFTGETCFGPCDGTAAVSPSGGDGTYTFLWVPEPDMGQGTDQVSGLCAGNWAVTITDGLGCDTTLAFTVLPYTAIMDDAVVSDVVCNGACDGSVLTAATGGVGVLTYEWTPEPPNGQGQIDATGLCPQELTLLITDAAGCDSLFTYTIVEPLVLEVSVDLLTPASCQDASDGAIGTTAFGGVPPYTFNWTGPDNFTSGAEDLSDLVPGAYDLTLSDLNGCTFVTQVVVNALVTVVAEAGPDQDVCLGTEILLDGSLSTGAVTYSWTDDQGNIIGTDTTLVLILPSSGTYTFTLTVTDGPCSSTDDVTINYLALPIADAGPDHTIFLSETATLGGSPSGPVGATYTWVPDTLLSDASAANPIADPATSTWYVLNVVGPNGCVDTDSVLVTVVPTVVIPSGFTPNSDGSNDAWVIDFIELFPDCEVEVYNRWGEQLFRSVGYKQPWDGKYRDGYVPVGTYYYVIELHDERFPEPYTGPLTVIR